MGTELNEFQGNVVPPSLKWIATERRPESSAASARYLHRCVQRILFFIAAKSSTPEVYCTVCEAIVCAGIFVPAWPEKGYQTHEFYRPKRKPGPMYFPKTTYLLQLSKGQLHDAFDLQQAGRQAKQRRRGGMRFRKKDHLKISFLYVRSRKLLSDRTANEYVYVHGLRYITVACVWLAVLHVCVCAPVCTRVLVCVCGHIPRCVLLCSLAGLFRRQLITTIRSVFLLRHRKPCMQQCQRQSERERQARERESTHTRGTLTFTGVGDDIQSCTLYRPQHSKRGKASIRSMHDDTFRCSAEQRALHTTI